MDSSLSSSSSFEEAPFATCGSVSEDTSSFSAESVDGVAFEVLAVILLDTGTGDLLRV